MYVVKMVLVLRALTHCYCRLILPITRLSSMQLELESWGFKMLLWPGSFHLLVVWLIPVFSPVHFPSNMRMILWLSSTYLPVIVQLTKWCNFTTHIVEFLSLSIMVHACLCSTIHTDNFSD
jgi:hypothetical protein